MANFLAKRALDNNELDAYLEAAMPELHWGETPWDNKSHDELLRDVQRMYSAVQAMYSCLNVIKAGSRGTPSEFWSDGTGGMCIEKGRQILEPLWKEFGNEEIYRSFFRYADDLLFEQAHGIGVGWCICPVCGTCLGTSSSGKTHVGEVCGDVLHMKSDSCPGIFRPLMWEDMKPLQEGV